MSVQKKDGCVEKQIELSVVVPVYNVEKYLNTCVDSILCGAATCDVEILLVDDGSTDGSGRICDDYSHKYPEIVRTVHKENGGLSDARNVGIQNAQGRYVAFLDSDDYYCPGTIEQLLQRITSAAQVYVGAMYTFEDGSNNLTAHEDVGVLAREGQCSGFEAMDRLLTLIPTYGWYAWKYVVQREFLVDNELWFTRGLLFEDVDWSPRMLAAAQRVEMLEQPFYCYRLCRKNSIMNSSKEEQKCRAQTQIVAAHVERFGQMDMPEGVRTKLYENLSGVYTSALYGSVLVKDSQLHAQLKDMQWMMRYVIRPTERGLIRAYDRFGYGAVVLILQGKMLKTRLKKWLLKAMPAKG